MVVPKMVRPPKQLPEPFVPSLGMIGDTPLERLRRAISKIL